MSAWMCSDKHLSALAAYFTDTVRNTDTFDDIFNQLRDANIASLEARYPGRTEDMIGGDPRPSYREGKQVRDELGAAGIAKLAHCFNYQACEIENYAGSSGDIIVQTILDNVLRSLTGYKDAPWGI